MSATSRLSLGGIAGRWSGALRKSGGVVSPSVRLSQSLNDTPARHAAASARSRMAGSMPSLLHDTREFMLLSGSAPAPPPGASGLPARPKNETIDFDAGRLPLQLDFFALR